MANEASTLPLGTPLKRSALNTRHRKIWICIALAVTTLAAYWPVHDFGFVNYDDNFYIYENPRVLSGLSLSNTRWAFTTYETSNYAPLTWLSYQLDATMFNARPGAMHVENVGWHIVDSILLFLLLSQLTNALWPAALAAGVFALHPVHVESVAWISERKDVLSTAFFLLAILSYVRYASARSTYRALTYFATAAFLTCGLLFKSMLVTFPCVLLLLDYWPLRRIGRVPGSSTIQKISVASAIAEKIPLMLLCAVSSFLTYRAQASIEASVHSIPLTLRAENAALSYCRYLANFFWPTNLSVLYPYRWHVLPGEAVLAGGFIILLALLAVLMIKHRPYLCAGFFWFLGTLVPVIGVVQVGAQSMADRYLYIPSIGLTIAVVWLLRELRLFATHQRVAATSSFAVLILLGVLTRRQVVVWKDTDSLFGHASITELLFRAALAENPGDFKTNFDLGNLMLETRPGEAVALYQAAAHTDARRADLQSNWGVALLKLNDWANAFEHFRMAESLDSKMYAPHYNLGRLYFVTGNRAKAQQEFQLALQAHPGDVPAMQQLRAVDGR